MRGRSPTRLISSEDTTCLPVHSVTGFRMHGGTVFTTRSRARPSKPEMAVNTSWSNSWWFRNVSRFVSRKPEAT